MTNQEIAALFHEAYNEFWLKWRDRTIADKDWDVIREEATQMAKKYPGKLSVHIMVELQLELEERAKKVR